MIQFSEEFLEKNMDNLITMIQGTVKEAEWWINSTLISSHLSYGLSLDVFKLHNRLMKFF